MHLARISRVRNTLANAIHNYFYENEFQWVNTPIVTGSDCEGAGELFRVSTLDLANLPTTPDGKPDFEKDFFGTETFLTCLLYTSPSPRDRQKSRMPSSA